MKELRSAGQAVKDLQSPLYGLPRNNPWQSVTHNELRSMRRQDAGV
ncbi:MAG: hypothetical protein R3C20_06400 [Planctomycetaceae bacterium]